MILKTLREKVTSRPRVDIRRGIIEGVKILGIESRNGRRYTLDALKRARHLYEGVSVRVNHPDDPDADRKSEDVLGRLRNVRLAPDGLYGDLEYLRSHPLARRLEEAAERMPSAYGLSHNAEGDGEYSDGVYVVKSITEVHSVDLVADPATTKGLFESHKRKGKPITLREWAQKQEKAVRVAYARILEACNCGSKLTEDDLGATAPEDALKGAFRTAINAILDDTTGDSKNKMERIKQVLKAEESLMQSGALTPPTADDEVDLGGEVDESSASDSSSTDLAAKLTEEDEEEVPLDEEPELDPDDDALVADDLLLDESDHEEPDGDEGSLYGDGDGDELMEEDEEAEDDEDKLALESARRQLAAYKLCESRGVVPTPAIIKALSALDTDEDRVALLRESRLRPGRSAGLHTRNGNSVQSFVESITGFEDE